MQEYLFGKSLLINRGPVNKKVLTEDLLFDLNSFLEDIERSRVNIKEFLKKGQSPIFDENDHEYNMILASFSPLLFDDMREELKETSLSEESLEAHLELVDTQESLASINYEREMYLLELKEQINLFKNSLFKIINLLADLIEDVSYKIIDDYSYAFKLNIENLLDGKEKGLYILSELSKDYIKINPYRLLDRLLRKYFKELTAIYDGIFKSDLDIDIQARSIELINIYDEVDIESLANWEQVIEDSKVIKLQDFFFESKKFRKEINLISNPKERNIKVQAILNYFMLNINYHITVLVEELGLNKFVRTSDEKYGTLYKHIYKVLESTNYNQEKYLLLLNLLNEYIIIIDSLDLTNEIKENPKQKVGKVFEESKKQGFLHIPAFNWVNNSYIKRYEREKDLVSLFKMAEDINFMDVDKIGKEEREDALEGLREIQEEGKQERLEEIKKGLKDGLYREN